MAKFQIIYWRDIPAQVKGKEGRRRLGRPLSARFPVAIDEAAMQAGLIGSDDYLSEWRSGDWQEHDGDAEAILDKLTAELETAYPPARVRHLIANHGLEEKSE